MPNLLDIYWFCVHLVITMANTLHLSYYEVNFWMFCVIFPGLLILTSIAAILQTIHLVYAMWISTGYPR